MKKALLSLFLVVFMGCVYHSHAQTTVANGNWTNPATWGGAPPAGTGTVVINHAVTLDIDYSHSAGSITINSSGSLIGGSALRVFALNYPSGTANLTIDGIFNVARVAFISGTVGNSGNFGADSLANYAILNNNATAVLNVAQFANFIPGSFTNDGSVISTNVANTGVFVNNSTIESVDMLNCKTFTNSATGTIDLSNDFLNSDSLASPALFTNNGLLNVHNNWRNDETIDGSGRFCIAENTMNTGMMSGTFDFCDITGGSIDLNTGTIDPTITYCLYSCGTVSVESASLSHVQVYPNPVMDICVFENDDIIRKIEVFNVYGQQVILLEASSHKAEIDMSLLSSGLYIYTLYFENNKSISGKLLKQ